MSSSDVKLAIWVLVSRLTGASGDRIVVFLRFLMLMPEYAPYKERKNEITNVCLG